MYRHVFLALLCLFVTGAGAQERYPFRQLLKRDGLSQNSVIGIAQDGKGFMWFGTRDGLNRYDGSEFRVYRRQGGQAHTLVYNDIHTLYYDDVLEQLWVGTTHGLCRYRQTTDDFVNYDRDTLFANRFIHFIQRDRSGQLWVGSDRGLYAYTASEDRFVRVRGIPQQTIRVMVQDDRGEYYVGMPDGLYHLAFGPDRASGSLTRIPVGSPTGAEPLYVQDILPASRDRLWVATRFSGLYQVDVRTGQNVRYHAGGKPDRAITDNNVRTLEWGRDSSLWAGTFVGLNLLVPSGKGTHYRVAPAPKETEDHSVHSLFTDRRGTLWMGSYFGGISYYDSRLEGIRHYSRREAGQRNTVVSAFAETATGDLWVGTEGGGLNYYDRAADTLGPYPLNGSLESNNVKTLLADGDRLWIGTYQGQLAYLDLTTGRIVRDWPFAPDSIRQSLNNVYDLLLRNDTLWVANYGEGLTAISLRSGAIQSLRGEGRADGSLLSDQCRSLFVDSRGHIWLVCQGGVSRLVHGAEGKLRFTHYLHDRVVHSLNEDRDGRIWAGTYSQGLYLIDPQAGTARHYTDGDGVGPESTIYSIVRDRAGLLWISSSQGVAAQDPATGRLRKRDTPFDLSEQEYRINAAHTSRYGEIIFGGTEGMTLFDPAELSSATELPPLVFTKVQVANEEVPIDPDGTMLRANIDEAEQLTLPYDNANFSLSFAPLDFLASDPYRYEYRLEGLDEEWVNSQGRTTVSYTLQNPGNYRFRVRISGAGIAGYRERALDVSVLPPPWRSWYAYLAYFLAGGALLAAGVRYAYLQHRLRKERQLKDQQEALHQAKLRFFTNITHELRTPLTLMVGPLESVRRSGEVAGETAKRLLTVEKNSRRLLQLVNELLTFRKFNGESDALHLDDHDLVEFCRDVTDAFQAYAATSNKKLRFVTDRDHHPVRFDRDKLEKVVYNLLANAFKFTADGGHITLSLRRAGTKMHLEVTDDGEGIPSELHERIFARFFERKSLTHREGTGIGLAVAREYVEMHGGEIDVVSTPGRGSTFRLWIPLRPPYTIWDAGPADVLEEESLPAAITRVRDELVAESRPDETIPLVLIVEDNGEVRDYIESVLVDGYRLLTAADGQQGFEQAQENHPDLIISDVMMPVMDGIALCSALKGDLQTSHIPIILLTARSSDLQKLEGLEIGANDYLTKPFSPRELQLRVQNLLRSIRSARDRTGRTLRLEPAEVQVTSADADFLERAIDAVNHHMDNSDYKVDDLARDLAVSRALLFTKMKAITGHTPNNFVKLLRMKRAAQLLATGEFLVAEVAAKVGYRDVKYFSSSFAKEHGCNPSAYGCEQTK